MRLVSWNIRGGKHPGVVDSAVALEPDVAVLVDCKEKHAKRIINEASSRGYKHHLESQLGYTGIVMISRHPLTQGEIKLLNVGSTHAANTLISRSLLSMGLSLRPLVRNPQWTTFGTGSLQPAT
jgi:exonuclease III